MAIEDGLADLVDFCQQIPSGRRVLARAAIFLALVATGLAISLLPQLRQYIEQALAAQVTIDNSVHAAGNSHNGALQTTVFISIDVGYTFFRDSGGSCVYSKTTDGGATWGMAVTVDPQTDCLKIGIWAETWTPGLSSNYVHIVTSDSGSSDLWYTRLDTATDTLTSTVNISSFSQGGSFGNGANIPAITVSTTGAIYTAVADASDSFVLRCSATCTNAGNWSEASPNPMDLANDEVSLAPLSNGDILLINRDISADAMRSRVWTSATNSWASSWTVFDANAPENSTFDAAWGMTINQATNTVYVAYASDIATLGSDDDIRTASFSDATRSWAGQTDVVTNTSLGITGVSLARDSAQGDLYVVYTGAATPGSPTTTANVYWKRSTDEMATWGTQTGPLNSAPGDIYGARPNMVNAERIYVTWVDSTPDDLFGDTIAELLDPREITQSSYRWFENSDATDVGAPLSAQNTPVRLATLGQTFRLRQALHIDNRTLAPGGQSFTLQYAGKGTGTCQAPNGTPSNYTDVMPYTNVSTSAVAFPSVAVNDTSIGTSAWTSPDNATAEDGAVVDNYEVFSNPTTNFLKTTGFNFNIPSTATIDGIVARYRKHSTAGGNDIAVRLVKDDVIQSVDRLGVTWTDPWVWDSVGSSSDLWGTTWTAADINSSGFGFAIAANRTTGVGGRLQIDAIKLEVFYSVETSPGIIFADNASASDNAALTVNAQDPTHAGHTIVAQTYKETAGLTNSIAAINANSDGLWDFVLQDYQAPEGTTYCFRIVSSGGTPLNAYAVYPEITTWRAGPTMEQRMTDGNWWSNGVRQFLHLD